MWRLRPDALLLVEGRDLLLNLAAIASLNESSDRPWQVTYQISSQHPSIHSIPRPCAADLRFGLHRPHNAPDNSAAPRRSPHAGPPAWPRLDAEPGRKA